MRRTGSMSQSIGTAGRDHPVRAILDVEVTTGEKNEGEMIEPQVDEVRATTEVAIKTVTADAGYAYAKVYGALERRDINAHSSRRRATALPVTRNGGTIMNDKQLVGPWVRRFLLEHWWPSAISQAIHKPAIGTP